MDENLNRREVKGDGRKRIEKRKFKGRRRKVRIGLKGLEEGGERRKRGGRGRYYYYIFTRWN